MSQSPLERLAELTPAQRTAYIASLQPDQIQRILDRDWEVSARPEQRVPWDDEWRWLMFRSGRNWGKTITGAHATRERIEWLAAQGVRTPRWALVSRRLKDVRRTMCEGETGLRQVIPPSMLIGGSWERSFNRGEVLLRLSNGAEIAGYSSESPGDLRGPQHHGAWVDEAAILADAKLGDAQDTTFFNLDAGLRLDPDPKGIITTTPRNNRLMRDLDKRSDVRVVLGHTLDNLSNLAKQWLGFVDRYQGTRLGRQELGGELLTDVGVMFSRADLEDPERLLDEAPHASGRLRQRAWDLASSQPGDSNPDPDWTVGARMSLDPSERLWTIEHVVRVRVKPGERDDRIRSTAVTDGLRYQHVEQYHGSAGLDIIASLNRHLQGVATVKGLKPMGTKAERADQLAAAVEQGRVRIVRGPWLEALVDEFEEFPDGAHDDIVDACAMAMRAIGERRELPDPAAGQAAGQRVPTKTPLPRAGARVTSSR